MSVLGIDIGGTKVRAGLVGAEGRLVRPAVSMATRALREDPEEIYSDILALARTVLQDESPEGIGIGCTGPLDNGRGFILDCANLPSLNNFPIAGRLSEDLGTHVVLDNDANAFTLAEQRFGAGRGFLDVVGITLGTGIGLGMVLDGKLRNGASGCAGEVWTSPYLDGIVEDDVSGPALGGKDAGGDAFASFAGHLAHVLAWTVNLLDPQMIVLGGSVCRSADRFLPSAEQLMKKKICSPAASSVRIRLAELGDDAGVIGAAALVL